MSILSTVGVLNETCMLVVGNCRLQYYIPTPADTSLLVSVLVILWILWFWPILWPHWSSNFSMAWTTALHSEDLSKWIHTVISTTFMWDWTWVKLTGLNQLTMTMTMSMLKAGMEKLGGGWINYYYSYIHLLNYCTTVCLETFPKGTFQGMSCLTCFPGYLEQST